MIFKQRACEIINDFEFFNSWEEKYEHIISLGQELPDLKKLKELDEYIPKTNWNIDSDSVTMDDLLNEVELTPVKHPVLIPLNHEI